MDSRERLARALDHRAPDRPPIDLGSTPVTGAHVSVVAGLRPALGLETRRVKVVEPYQMLGEIDGDLMSALGVDCIGLGMRKNLFGFENEGWKPWVTFDGAEVIEVLVPGAFNTDLEPNGDLLQYPEGDRAAAPSGRMPRGGFYHDTIVRQPPIDDDTLRVEDNLEEFGRVTDEDLEHLSRTAEALYESTPYAIVGNFGGTGFGDIALVPAMWLKNPKGIRDIEEWYVSTIARRDYIFELFSGQCEIALGNLELVRQAVGDRVAVIFVTGTDFGAQNAPFISNDTYRDLYQPFHKRVNDWVHEHTKWKTFIHSCGAVEPLIGEFIAAGFDILNPVQCSAAGMSPEGLKSKYGDRISFWGGGVDTQKTLPFGTKDEVAEEVRERLRVFSPGGGFVFNPIHNIQPNTPIENVAEMFRLACRGASGSPDEGP
ncbi:MAG: uroporphyrinogen decarboxylase family protein [Planctomycetota bacterium]|jgi:hypothetical protein